MKFARTERTSDKQTVAVSTSTSSRPSNCEACPTMAPLHQIILQPSKYSRPPSQPFWLATMSIATTSGNHQQAPSNNTSKPDVGEQTAELIRTVEINTAALRRGRPNQIDTLVELSQLVVRAGAIRHNLHSVQRHRNVRAICNPPGSVSRVEAMIPVQQGTLSFRGASIKSKMKRSDTQWQLTWGE